MGRQKITNLDVDLTAPTRIILSSDEKTTPHDSDFMGITEGGFGSLSSSLLLKKISWPSIKTSLKAYFDTLYATIGSGGGGGSLPAWITDNPDNPPTSPDSMDDEFEGSSLDSKWTTQNMQTAVHTVAHGLINIASPSTGTSHRAIGVIEQPLPSGTWKFRCKVFRNYPYLNYPTFCFGVRDGDTNKTRYLGWIDHTTNGVITDFFSPAGWDGYSGENAKGMNIYTREAYFEIEHTADNVIHYRTSSDGWNYVELYSVTDASYTTNPQFIGIGVYAYTAVVSISLDWFRRIA